MQGSTAHRDAVERRFDSEARRWADYYREHSVEGVVYRRRQQVALDWIDGLGLGAGAPVLDAGCGAGELTAALSERGFVVDAVDAVPAMVAQVRERDLPRVRVKLADAAALPFPDRTFALVAALGLLPWVESPSAVVRELARVLSPGGHAVLTVDNRYRLSYLVDPRLTPLAQPLKEAARRLRGRRQTHAPAAGADLDGYVTGAGLEQVAWGTVGFGPFTLLGRSVLPDRWSTALHGWLQARADRGWWLLARRGAHFMVLARRPIES